MVGAGGVAIYQRGLGFGDATLPADLVLPHTTAQAVGQVLVSGGETEAIDGLVAGSPGVQVLERDAYLDQLSELREDSAWVNFLLTGVLLCYVAISVVNTLVMATGERSRELTLIRLVGGTRKQVFRMLRLEALFIAAVGWGLAPSPS